MLDQTIVLFGSNLGNASSHDNKNLPIIVAGGGFRHGQHLAFDPTSQIDHQPHARDHFDVVVNVNRRLGYELFGDATGNLFGICE